MRGLSTLLSTRVESLLPRADAAACVPASPWCSETGVTCSPGGGDCHGGKHRECHLSCHGKAVCGSYVHGPC